MGGFFKRIITVESLTCFITGALTLGLGAIFLLPRATQPAAGRVVPGVSLRPVEGYAWRSHGLSLVLALHVGCPYCQESMPFYERLHALERSRDIGAHVVAVWPDDPALVKRSLPAGLSGVQVVPNVDLKRLGVIGTPTLFLVDNTGRVERVWEGELSPTQENDVLLTLGAARHSPKPHVPCPTNRGCLDALQPEL